MTTTTRDKLANGLVIGTLCLGAVAFAAFGVQWLVHPEAMAHDLGILLTNGDATSDARAVYGGMELGLGAFLAYSAWSPARRSQGLAAAMMTLLGLGLSRLIGIVFAAGGVSGATRQLLVTDLGGAALCAAVFFVSRRQTPPLESTPRAPSGS
jgi:Domain of unknown function (DUF4345)